MTRGIRNNNPLNIRYSATPWKGKVLKEHKHDENFEEFTSMYFGFRAALINIETYIIKYGCNTIAKIISRWAPSSDLACCKECAVRIKAAANPPLQSTQACIGCNKRNRPDDYIKHICRITNTGGNEPISNHSRKLRDIVAAMAFIESGRNITAYYDSLDRAFEDFVPREVYQPEPKRHYKL